MSVANQKIIINKSVLPYEDYLMISNNSWIEASQKLTPSGFQLYLFLLNKPIKVNGKIFEWELSNKAICDIFGFQSKTYTRVVKDLIDNRYLICVGDNRYEMYDRPNYVQVDSQIEHYNSNPKGGRPSKINADNNKLIAIRKTEYKTARQITDELCVSDDTIRRSDGWKNPQNYIIDFKKE